MDLQPLLPLLLVIVGWLVVHTQTNHREFRKEGRALIDTAKKAAVDLAKNAVAYHCDGKTEFAFEIKAGLEALEIDLERTPHFWVKDGPLMGAFVAFSEALVGANFESAAFVKQPMNSSLVAAILRTRNGLMSELERQRRVHYL